MKFRIHFTAGGVEDSFEIEGDTIAIIQSRSMKELERRGLGQIMNSVWSEPIT